MKNPDLLSFGSLAINAANTDRATSGNAAFATAIHKEEKLKSKNQPRNGNGAREVSVEDLKTEQISFQKAIGYLLALHGKKTVEGYKAVTPPERLTPISLQTIIEYLDSLGEIRTGPELMKIILQTRDDVQERPIKEGLIDGEIDFLTTSMGSEE